jgi:hypothetical protein
LWTDSSAISRFATCCAHHIFDTHSRAHTRCLTPCWRNLSCPASPVCRSCRSLCPPHLPTHAQRTCLSHRRRLSFR